MEEAERVQPVPLFGRSEKMIISKGTNLMTPRLTIVGQ